jgi:hypothetical protein
MLCSSGEGDPLFKSVDEFLRLALEDPKLKQKMEEIGKNAINAAAKGLAAALNQVQAIMMRLWDMKWYHKIGALIIVFLIVIGGLVAAGFSLSAILSSIAASVCSVAQIAWVQLQKGMLAIAASETTVPFILASFGISGVGTGFNSQLASALALLKTV